MNAGQPHAIQTSTENNYSRKEQPPRAAIGCSIKCQHEERNRVNEMIKHRLIPNINQTVSFERWLQPVRPKRTEPDRQKTKRRRNSNEEDRHRATISLRFSRPATF